MRLRTRDDLITVTVGDAEVDAYPLSTSEVNRIARKHTKTQFKRGRPVEESDNAAFALEVWQKTINGWRNVNDEDGAPIQCDAEGKELVWDKNPDFATETMEAIDAAKAMAEEEASGNS